MCKDKKRRYTKRRATHKKGVDTHIQQRTERLRHREQEKNRDDFEYTNNTERDN